MASNVRMQHCDGTESRPAFALIFEVRLGLRSKFLPWGYGTVRAVARPPPVLNLTLTLFKIDNLIFRSNSPREESVATAIGRFHR